MYADIKKTVKPRRRWLRFSLRTLLILVTVLSVPLGWVGWRLGQIRREQATIAWIEERGGEVSFQYGTDKSWWEKTTDKWFGERRVRSVSLHNKQVSDVSPLMELKNPTFLNLGSTHVSDLSPLAELKNPAYLDFQNTQVIDLSPLAELKSLRTLVLRNTQVSDLSPLAELKSLELLWLDNTQVSDASPLMELKNLTFLNLGSTHVSDVSPLVELKSLELLWLDNTHVSDEQVQKLRQALPNCEIHLSIRVEK